MSAIQPRSDFDRILQDRVRTLFIGWYFFVGSSLIALLQDLGVAK